MSVRRDWIGKAALGGLFLGYQYVSHLITASGHLTAAGAAFVLLPLAAAAAWMLALEFGAAIALAAGLGVALAGVLLVGLRGLPDPVILYGLPHFAANLFLFWFFSRSLRASRVALVTRIAQRVHGPLGPALLRYTRRVTVAWSAFFAAQLLASAALYAYAPLEAWSWFVNVVGSLLIPAMFLAEYAVRRCRHRGIAHASILAGADLFSERVGPGPSEQR